MKIKYKDLEIETKEGEELPFEISTLIDEIKYTLETIHDMIKRGLLKPF